MGEGNKKLSKRDPESSLNLYRERGFLPEGLLNYLSLLGWSLSADQDIFSIDEMVAAFDIADVNANPARFDLKKAEAINADHIRLLDVKAFTEACAPWLRAPHAPWAPEDFDRGLGGDRPVRPDPADGPLGHHGQRRLPLPGGAGRRRGVLDEGDEGGLATPCCHRPREAGRRRLDRPESLKDAVLAAGEEHGLKLGKAQAPVRVAVTGRTVGLPLFESLEILGKRAAPWPASTRRWRSSPRSASEHARRPASGRARLPEPRYWRPRALGRGGPVSGIAPGRRA